MDDLNSGSVSIKAVHSSSSFLFNLFCASFNLPFSSSSKVSLSVHKRLLIRTLVFFTSTGVDVTATGAGVGGGWLLGGGVVVDKSIGLVEEEEEEEVSFLNNLLL